MSKYLIQDIIPPERKRRGALHHKVKKATEDTSRDLPVATTQPVDTREQEDRIGDYPEHKIHQVASVSRAPISEEFPENPREMIVDQIERGDTLHESSLTPSPLRENFPQFPEYSETGSGNIMSRMRAWLPWLVGVAVSLAAGVLLLNFFASASVMIVQKHETLPMDEKFSAFKNGTSSDLYYAIMSTTTSLSLEVPATGEKTVTAKASGRVVVYNKQGVAQRLVKNTRFQTPDGRIYRINDSITVPKMTVTGGKSVPGLLEVTVYADEAGPVYNSDPVDFTLPGLKSSPLFTKVYARSNGPIVGGASGTVKTVSGEDMKQAGEDLRIQLETKLRAKARGDLAPFQIAYDPGIVVEFSEPLLSKVTASANNKAVVTREGRIMLVFFKRDELTKAILQRLVKDYTGEEVDIKNLESLQFTMSPQNGDTLASGAKLDFSLKGTPELVWTIDEAATKSALLGISKESFNEILSRYSSIERAKATVSPMWKRSFPNNPDRISVVFVDQLPN